MRDEKELWKVRAADGKVYGPYDEEHLAQYLAEDRLRPEDLARSESTGAAKQLGELVGRQQAEEGMVPPPPPAREAGAAQRTDAFSGIVPYRNAYALFGYYLAVFSIIPFVGSLLGIAGFVLGLLGLRHVREHPEARGKVHAWIGIIVGGLFGFGYLFLTIVMIAGVAAGL